MIGGRSDRYRERDAHAPATQALPFKEPFPHFKLSVFIFITAIMAKLGHMYCL
jgi:hypothetical protein